MSATKTANVLFFSAKEYDVRSFDKFNTDQVAKITYIPEVICEESFNKYAAGQEVDAVCVFVNDPVPADLLDFLKAKGVKAIVSRCMGIDRVDTAHANKIGIQHARVPAYSPYSVAEFCIGVLLCLNRKLCLAYNRTATGNFALEGLQGYDLRGKTAGIIGMGKIGLVLCDLLLAFGMKVACYDVFVNEEYAKKPGVTYMSLDELYPICDVISLHTPLLPTTKHIVCKESIAKMKDGVIIINAGRGGLVDADAVLDGIASRKVGGYAPDTYENEKGVFYNDCTFEPKIAGDKTLGALMASPHVMMTGHQGYLTDEALAGITQTTLHNLTQIFREGKKDAELDNWVNPKFMASG